MDWELGVDDDFVASCGMRPRTLLVPIVFAAILSVMPSVSARSTDARLAALAPAVRKNLEQAIIPFWYPQSIHREHGGYVLAPSIAPVSRRAVQRR